jgi:hypothetical protein
MIYIANGAPSARLFAADVVMQATVPRLVLSSSVLFFRATPEEYKSALSAWNSNEAARRAVTEALGLKLQWLEEQKVPWVPRINLMELDGDLRYHHAVCNALADIVRDTKIIHKWRQYKLDRYQHRRDWQQFERNYTSKSIRARNPDWEQHRPLDWQIYKLEKEHPATKEARLWYEAASALQSLVDPQKRDPKTKRDYPEIDLPEFELAPSWVYLSAAK